MIRVVAFDLDFTLYDERAGALYEGIESGLKSLKENFSLAIITNGSEENQLSKLAGIESYFDFLYFVGFVSRHKPDPWAFERLLEDAKVSPEEVIYVGNNPFTDFIPCKLLGIKSIRVCTDEFGRRDVHEFLDADVLIDTPQLAIKYVKKDVSK